MIRIVFFGTPQFAVPSLESLIHDSGIEVLGVVTQPDKRRGRGKDLMPSAVKKIALEYDFPVWQPKNIKKHRETLEELRLLEADAFVVVAYGQLLSSEILNMPRYGCINGHASLLPAYRGAAPIQWSLFHGDRLTGMTTMLMNEGMDTGDILLTAETPIDITDHAMDLAIRLSLQCAFLLLDTLKGLAAGMITPRPQDDGQATHARLITKEDYGLDWNQSAIALHNQIRAFFPNCVTSHQGKPLKISETFPLVDPYLDELFEAWEKIKPALDSLPPKAGKPGEIVAIVKNLGPIVATGDGYLFLETVQPQGKRSQSGWDFCNGMHIQPGVVLGT